MGIGRKSLLWLVLLVIAVPIALLVAESVAYGWRWPEVIPHQFSLRGWRVVFGDPKIVTALQTTVIIGACVVVLNLAIAFPAGKALAWFSFKGKSVIESFLLLPILVPALAVAMGLQITMIRFGLADHITGVILVHLLPTLPYSLRIMRAGYERLGMKWIEQARTLGAQPWTIFSTVSLPLLLPSLRSLVLLTFVISLSQYVLTAVIGGGLVTTLPIIYYPFLSSSDPAVIATFSLVFVLMPIAFMAAVEGMTRVIIWYKKMFT
ncbi:MAG TPA: ABC transporter permease subunit [Bacillales bacterium]